MAYCVNIRYFFHGTAKNRERDKNMKKIMSLNDRKLLNRCFARNAIVENGNWQNIFYTLIH